jgi:hypothetical protein
MRYVIAAATVAAVAAVAILIGCGSSGSSSSTGQATANVVLSDPATCQAPGGPFAHVYVTVTDVKASTSSSASASGSGFVDLTPGLSSAPMQIDLLGQANNQCFLATLGSTKQLPPGDYQQIRVYLASNSTSVPNNKCNNSANCVVLSDGTVEPLELSSETQTGIKIPSGQIASGGFNINSGQTKDLDINFNTCVSLVAEGNGKYRLKPVLHAGEVSTTSTSINGTVLDSATGNPVSGRVMVALEQKDSTGVDRIFMTTMADSQGGFTFCPLPAGDYDMVIVAETNTGMAYAPVVISGVSPGDTISTVHLNAAAAVPAATLSGMVTSQGTSSGVGVDVQLSFLEQVSSSMTVTMPLLPNANQSSSMLSLSTVAGSTCPGGTYCVSYSADMPAASAYVGAYASSGIVLAQAGASAYMADAIAFAPASGETLDCTPNEVRTTTAITPVAGSTTNVAALAFTGCQ